MQRTPLKERINISRAHSVASDMSQEDLKKRNKVLCSFLRRKGSYEPKRKEDIDFTIKPKQKCSWIELNKGN